MKQLVVSGVEHVTELGVKQVTEASVCYDSRTSRKVLLHNIFQSQVEAASSEILRHHAITSTPRKMVQFRGININIVSQFDTKRLPEHSTARAFDASGTVVACYVPVHAGAQIWLEYSIDGPHPPKAAYFFKMFMNNQVVISWVSQVSLIH